MRESAESFTQPRHAVMKSRHLRTALSLAVSLLAASHLAAADHAPNWLTGSAFERKLASPATVLWADSPLRDALRDFAGAQQTAVVLDRRVDPDQELHLAVRNESVFAVIQKIAIDRNLRASVLGNVVYVGPARSAEWIRTVAELRRIETEACGSAVAESFAETKSMQWHDLATPKAVLKELADQNDLEILNLQRVPHDLWPSADLPPLSLTERLTLILQQFDLTFHVVRDGRQVTIGPIDPNVAIVRDYDGRADPARTVEKWQSMVPRCEFRIVGDRIYVRGRLEDHEAIGGTARPWQKQDNETRPKRSSEPPAGQVFTVDVPNRPLGRVLTQFARQLGLELQIDQESFDEAGVSLDQLVTFRVQEATFDELFQAALAPIGCFHRREGDVLRIWAQPGESPGKKQAKGR